MRWLCGCDEFWKKYPLNSRFTNRFTSISFFLAFLFLSFLGSSFLLFSFSCTLCLGTSPEIKASVLVTDALNVSSACELLDETACNGSIDLELFDQDSAGDAQDFWHFSKDLVVFLLLEEYFVIGLISNLDLSPLLCFCLSTSLLSSLSALWSTRSLFFSTRLSLFGLHEIQSTSAQNTDYSLLSLLHQLTIFCL